MTMSSLLKKYRDQEAITYIKQRTGKKPKHRCPMCHMFTLYRTVKGENLCIWCNNTGKLKKDNHNGKD
jgi:hypothetical protein